MCLVEIPKRLDLIAQEKKLGSYYDFFTNIIYDIFQYKSNPHTEYTDVVDYLWKYYKKIQDTNKLEILQVSGQPVLVNNSYLPVIFKPIVVSFTLKQILREISEYVKFLGLNNKKSELPQEMPESIVRQLFLNFSSKLDSIRFNLRIRTALA
jgi:hypothetical protein